MIVHVHTYKLLLQITTQSIGRGESVPQYCRCPHFLISGVKMYTILMFGTAKAVLIRGVYIFQDILIEGVSCLSKGASCLTSGVSCLTRGVSCLTRGVSCLTRGMSCLTRGVSCLTRGIEYCPYSRGVLIEPYSNCTVPHSLCHLQCS